MTALVFRPFLARYRPAHPIPWVARSRVGLLDWPCLGDHDYAEGLRMIWPVPVPVVVIEHDILPGHVLSELLDCPEPFCAPMYQLYPVTTGLAKPVWAHRDGDDWIPEWQPHASMVGLGMAKLSWRGRQSCPPPPLVNWSYLDTALSKHLAVQWHIHKTEVAHLHQ